MLEILLDLDTIRYSIFELLVGPELPPLVHPPPREKGKLPKTKMEKGKFPKTKREKGKEQHAAFDIQFH